MNDKKETTSKQAIIQLILKWKLSSAEVQLQKDEAALSDPTRRELSRLIEQYRDSDGAFVVASVSDNSRLGMPMAHWAARS